tara:strand:+ start:486 stop:1085 length:600 start_codon:yes stop_codon:yes gene_type:complete
MFNKIIRYNKLDSTNSLLSNLVRDEKIKDNLVIVADFQTKGRGQIEKKWYSEENKNLLFSIYIKPDNVSINQKSYFNIITSLAIIYSLKKFIKTSSIEIKSPNDILVDGRKISGILIETSIFKRKIKSLVIGVGININQKVFPFKENNPISMFQILKHNVDRNLILNLFLEFFSDLFVYFKNKDYDYLDNKYKYYLREF